MLSAYRLRDVSRVSHVSHVSRISRRLPGVCDVLSLLRQRVRFMSYLKWQPGRRLRGLAETAPGHWSD